MRSRPPDQIQRPETEAREFVPAATLKTYFRVHGHFYDVSLASLCISCRSVLEIVRHDFRSGHHQGAPDAVVIMMNPGSSKPLRGEPEQLKRGQLPSIRKKLVSTRPDTTQYQIMRVMHSCGWDYVRVLNLSDLREPKSANFARQYRSLESDQQYRQHSIFCDGRTRELTRALRRKPNAPIICAWGISPQLDPLIGQCTHAIRQHGAVVGLQKGDCSHRYFHPLPALQGDKRAWVTDMVALLQAWRLGGF
jgi:hypothetical protein